MICWYIRKVILSVVFLIIENIYKKKKKTIYMMLVFEKLVFFFVYQRSLKIYNLQNIFTLNVLIAIYKYMKCSYSCLFLFQHSLRLIISWFNSNVSKLQTLFQLLSKTRNVLVLSKRVFFVPIQVFD